MFKEFKEFAMKGNVLDLAIGIIMGTAFGKIITSLVNDIIMPPIGLLLGNVNFVNLYINLSGKTFASLEEAKKAGAAVISYGVFLNTVLDFNHRGVHHVPVRAADQPHEKGTGARRSHDQRMQVLPVRHSDQGHTLPALHVATVIHPLSLWASPGIAGGFLI